MENKMDTVTLENKKEDTEMKYEQIGLDLGFNEAEETTEKEKIEMTERTKEELMLEEKKVKVEALDKMSQAYYNAIVYLEDNWTDRPSDDIAYKAFLKAYRDTSKQSIELLEEIEGKDTKESKEMKKDTVKLYRFVPKGEVEALKEGETITHSKEYTAKTLAERNHICFMAGDPVAYIHTDKELRLIDPIYSQSSLDGVVDKDYLLEVEVNLEDVVWGVGYYADFVMEEAYVTSYNKDNVTKITEGTNLYEKEDDLAFGPAPLGKERTDVFKEDYAYIMELHEEFIKEIHGSYYKEYNNYMKMMEDETKDQEDTTQEEVKENTKGTIKMRNSQEKQTLTQEERMFKLVKGIVNDELTLKQVVAVLDTFDGDMIVRTCKNLKFVNKKTAYMNLQFVKDVNKDTGGLEQVDTVLRGMEYRYPVLNQSTEKPKKGEKTKKETSNTQGALSEEEVVRELVSGYLNGRLNKAFVVKASKGLDEGNQKHLLSLFVKAGKRLSENTKVSDKERKAYQTMLLDIIEELSPVEEEEEESELVTKGGEVVESVKEKLAQWKETYLNEETKEKATNRFKEGYNKALDKLRI